MADADLNILVRAKGALQAARDIGKVDSSVSKLGRTAARGAKTAATNLGKVGVIAGAGIAIMARQGIESLAELEDATTSVDGAIAQMGIGGKVTSGQIATWANEIEGSVDAAFDDKAIVSATATLIRFGKVTPQNIKPAMQIITDLATKTGDVDSAATLLAKALADPEKAAGKLARQGVILTKEQQKQIKAFMKAGKVAEAQEVILDSLAETTKGAAKASAGPYRDSLNVLTDVTEDAQRALGEGFLPVIMEVRDLLQGELAKPSTVANIRDFGKGLAGGLKSLVGIAKNLPWGAIGDSLRVAGAGAKAVLDAFVALPPWIQTAVISGWGLNKLSGGALSSIVGTLASGLIKGVLGMTAGVVNINAGVVNGGGVPGAGGGSGPASLVGILGPAAIAAAAMTAATVAANADLTSKGITGQFQTPGGGILPFGIEASLNNIATGIKILQGQKTPEEIKNAAKSDSRATLQVEQAASRTQRSVDAAKTKIDRTTTSVETARGSITTAQALGASRIVAAINSIPAPTVSSVTINRTTTISDRTGTRSGSRDDDKGGAFGGH